MSENATLRYVHQDHLSGTSLMTDINGDPVCTIMKYFPFGYCRNSTGDLGTDKLFTGQRLDATGLYYYGARYYDPTIGRFISPDTFMLSPTNPQGLNRYTYAFNNPLKFNDPSGNWPPFLDKFISQAKDVAGQGINAVKEGLQVAASKTVEIYQTAKELPGKAQEAAMHAVGIERVEYYTDSRSITDPVPVYHVGDQGIVPSLLGDVSGVSLYPVGTFVKESYYQKDSSISAHESYHYYEQSNWGMGVWLTAYYGEMALDWAYYGGDYWSGPYNNNSREIAARDYAGQPTYPYTTQTPWWQEPWNDFTQSVGSSLETIGNYYYDYYSNYDYWYYGY
jgi:RHS repeat-associated protein